MRATKLLGTVQQIVKLNCPAHWRCTEVATDLEVVEVSLVDLGRGNGWIVKLPYPGRYQDEIEEGTKIALEALCLVHAI